ncbi:MAG: hypothetical protein ACD_19C00006G0002 [uncultured bacterium]|nr:MAG: hypothetical protein ACD_19C00006G0002 [uncultured bacterium]
MINVSRFCQPFSRNRPRQQKRYFLGKYLFAFAEEPKLKLLKTDEAMMVSTLKNIADHFLSWNVNPLFLKSLVNSVNSLFIFPEI